MSGFGIRRLALRVLFQAGASEIYLDGELIYKFGVVGTREGEEKPYWKRDPQGHFVFG